MTLFRKLTGLFQPTPPSRAVSPLPVPTLMPAAPFTPAPAPSLPVDPVDAEVMRLYRLHNGDPVAVAMTLIAVSRDLDQEIADLHAELARLNAQPRFKP